MSIPSGTEGYIHQDGFAARLRHVVNVSGGPSALARAIGRSEGAVRKWLRAESEPNVSDVRAICASCNASLEWLINGVGDSGLIPHAVRETPAAYRPLQEMDHRLLEEILLAVEEAAETSGARIATNRKSGMVAALYGLCQASGTVDRHAVSRLVRLAA